MGQFDSFYKAKDYIVDILKKELVGPTKEDEVLDTPPLNTYVSGILWAKSLNRSVKYHVDEDAIDYELNQSLLEGALAEDGQEELAVPESLELEEVSDDVIVNASVLKPSTMGLSVILSKEVEKVLVSFSFAKYKHSQVEQDENGTQRIKNLYSRRGYKIELTFDFSKDRVEYFPEANEDIARHNLSIKATKRTGKVGESRLVTFSVSNDLASAKKEAPYNESAVFQCKLELNTNHGAFLPLEPEVSSVYDLEDEKLAMQYKNSINYVQGHGCATDFFEQNGECKSVWSEFVPIFELRQMKPPEVEDEKLFSLRYLYTGRREEIIKRLTDFVQLYQQWAEKQRELGLDKSFSKYPKAVEDCLCKIQSCIIRISNGIKTLSRDDLVWRAFVYTNKAMYKQRVSMAIIKGKISNASEFCDKMPEPSWYPFQLFYLLMIIPDFANPQSVYKDVVDLLWFPTGGGKTEAYFAVSAFIIFYERLIKRQDFYGTTIIMRYTLRLLTIQQFERATALICACERVRKEENLRGNEISIGLWIGNASTPNTIDEAKKALEKKCNGDPLYDFADPVQITKCPYCGKQLNALNYHIEGNSMVIECDDCGRLPIYIVDSDIYEKMPTLVISTVDKFARIVWEERAGRIFGCNVNVGKPRLIIQDELHLISGPLGTLTGLYETAVDRMCWDKFGVKPKIIASTATVKNAAYQIKGLYNRYHFQFPPSGLDSKDSFFAVEATKDDKPSRFYIGMSEQDGSMVDLLIRVFSTLILCNYYLEKDGADNKLLDHYYTIIGYFNAIKELGTASTILKERMYSYVLSLLNGKFALESEKLQIEKSETGKFKENFKLRSGELTSRKSASEVKTVLDELSKEYKKDADETAYKYVLSSNMFSVGVDIDRLGLMVVYGQPKSNADYIQATSRVGRSNPGIVFCIYNALRSRDRSYYEGFKQYHSCVYKHVESTSVTPFSMRSIEKGLHSVFIALVRHLVPGMSANTSAKFFDVNNKTVRDIEKYLIDRIQSIQPSAVESAIEFLEEFKTLWSNAGSSLVYNAKKEGRRSKEYTSLLQSSENGTGEFTVLNSVRHVEHSSNVYVIREDNKWD